MQGNPCAQHPGASCTREEGVCTSRWLMMPLCVLRLPAPAPDPLEANREVCELDPNCDEAMDQFGLEEAYKRTYGTTV